MNVRFLESPVRLPGLEGGMMIAPLLVAIDAENGRITIPG